MWPECSRLLSLKCTTFTTLVIAKPRRLLKIRLDPSGIHLMAFQILCTISSYRDHRFHHCTRVKTRGIDFYSHVIRLLADALRHATKWLKTFDTKVTFLYCLLQSITSYRNMNMFPVVRVTQMAVTWPPPSSLRHDRTKLAIYYFCGQVKGELYLLLYGGAW
jgi:hypothetical protein